jgi:hypothetical protein
VSSINRRGTFQPMRQQIRDPIEVLGIVPMKYEQGTALHNHNLKLLLQQFGNSVWPPVAKRTIWRGVRRPAHGVTLTRQQGSGGNQMVNRWRRGCRHGKKAERHQPLPRLFKKLTSPLWRRAQGQRDGLRSSMVRSNRAFTMTPTGLIADEGATFEQWQKVGEVLQKLDASIQWLLGDWLVYGERVWGQTYEQIAEATGYEVTSLRQYAWVARGVDLSIRIDKLSFGHHMLVAGLEPESQRNWLGRAAPRIGPYPKCGEK